MADPTSRQGELIPKLAEFLTQESIAYYPNINWLYYSNDHDPSMPPMGSIYIPKIKPSFQKNYEWLELDYQIYIRLLISNINESALIESLENWCGHLLTTTLRKLRKEGHDGYFLGINVNEANITPNINQDRGGTGQIMISCLWSDDAKIAGDQYEG